MVGVFFLCGEMLKKFFLGGCAGLDYFLKNGGWPRLVQLPYY